MPRRPAQPSSQFWLLARETRPSRGCDPSPAGGTTRVSCGKAGMILRQSLFLPSRTRPRVVARTRSSSTASWRSGLYGRRCPWWPTICPESPRFVLSFPMRWSFSEFSLWGLTPVLFPPGAGDPISLEVGLPSPGEGCLGPASVAEGPSCRRQRAPVGAERRGGGPPPLLCQHEGRGGRGSGAARPSGGAGQGVGGGAYPRGQ